MKRQRHESKQNNSDPAYLLYRADDSSDVDEGKEKKKKTSVSAYAPQEVTHQNFFKVITVEDRQTDSLGVHSRERKMQNYKKKSSKKYIVPITCNSYFFSTERCLSVVS